MMNIENGFLVQKQRKNYPNEKLQSYEEYKKLYTEESWAKWHIIRTFYTQFGWHFCYFYSVCRVRVESESTEKNGLFMSPILKRYLPRGLCAERR